MATFKSMPIDARLQKDLDYLLRDLQTRHQIKIESLIATAFTNDYAIGCPRTYSFAGQDGHQVFVGEGASWNQPVWLFFSHLTRTPTSIVSVDLPRGEGICQSVGISSASGHHYASGLWKTRDKTLFDSSPIRQVARIRLMGILDVPGFSRFIELVMGQGPEFKNWPGPRKDMDWEWTTMALRFGLNLLEHSKVAPLVFKDCRNLVQKIDSCKMWDEARTGLEELRRCLENVELIDPAILSDQELLENTELRCKLLKSTGIR